MADTKTQIAIARIHLCAETMNCDLNRDYTNYENVMNLQLIINFYECNQR